MALLPVVGQDAMIPVGDNDTSTPVARISDGKMHIPRLRKNVGGFCDACLLAGWAGAPFYKAVEIMGWMEAHFC